jgi:hypothetical protein
VGTILLLTACVAFLGPASAAEERFNPQFHPTLEVRPLEGQIKIDGELNDTGWLNAARATGFSEITPDNLARPPVETEVLLAYDEKQLYLAFVAADSDPGAIRSSLCDRDEMYNDDYVGVMIDPYGDAALAFELISNPIGVQGDGLQSLGTEDMSIDLVFYSAGRITERGYQVEMAIPFNSLRFPDKPSQVWRATFFRTHPRESRRQYSWAAIDLDDPCLLCQLGTLTGIHNVRPGGKTELLPSVIGFQSGALRDADDPNSGFENNDPDGEASLGVRYAITPSLTAEGSWNPDFSQVESDPAELDVNETFALFFPERRPFFQEGSDLFDTWYDLFYTRSINDPLFAARLTGRMSRTSFAYIVAHDEHSPVILPFEERSVVIRSLGKSTTNVVRFRQTFLENSYAGIMGTDRRLEGGGASTTFGADGVCTFFKKYRFEWQFLASCTEEPNDTALTEGINDLLFDNDKHTAAYDGEEFWGHAFYTSFERSAKHWSFDLDYWETSPTFRADNGFVTRNNSRQVCFDTYYDFYPTSPLLDQLEPGFEAGRIWNFDGLRKDEWLSPWLYLLFKGQTELRISYLYSRENYRGIKFDRMDRLELNLDSEFSDPLKLGFYMVVGPRIARNEDPPVMGNAFDFEASMDIKPIDRLLLEPEYQFSRLTRQDDGSEIFSGYILRSRLNYQFTRELFLRLVVQYDDFDKDLTVEPLVSYKLNPFTIFYLGSLHDYRDYESPHDLKQTSRQFFLKFQYLFRI